MDNAFYAQSGGPTAVINATACGVLKTARQKESIGTVYAGQNGILGALTEALIDTRFEEDSEINALAHTAGSAFGSCRYRLPAIGENDAIYQRLFSVFDAHNIRYFFYNGGGDSQETTHKISEMSRQMGYDLCCIGLPKTVDNDLMHTDNCPGYGSAAKYIATSIREATLDVASMASNSTQIFLLEIMGRHAGWLAAAAGLAHEHAEDGPHLILFPEIPFNQLHFLRQVEDCVAIHGHCSIAVSEGIKDENGQFITNSSTTDSFGHVQLGGAAGRLAAQIKHHLGFKYHWAMPDYLQRSARHYAAKTDLDQAYALGCHAVDAALEGHSDIMLTIERIEQSPYKWRIGSTPLASIAGQEKMMPRHFISQDGFSITQDCRDYITPLIEGEAWPPFVNGLPKIARLKKKLLKPKLAPFHP